MKSDTLIIFGRSPFINEIREYIPELCNRFYALGCNYFVDSFPCVDAVIFYDNIVPKVTDQLVITQSKWTDNPLVRSHSPIETYKVNRTKDLFTDKPGELTMFFHTPSMALSWARLKGFKRIYLAGVDLEPMTAHFDSSVVPEWEPKGLEEARNHFEAQCKDLGNVFQINAKSTLKIRKSTVLVPQYGITI